MVLPSLCIYLFPITPPPLIIKHPLMSTVVNPAKYVYSNIEWMSLTQQRMVYSNIEWIFINPAKYGIFQYSTYAIDPAKYGIFQYRVDIH